MQYQGTITFPLTFKASTSKNLGPWCVRIIRLDNAEFEETVSGQPEWSSDQPEPESDETPMEHTDTFRGTWGVSLGRPRNKCGRGGTRTIRVWFSGGCAHDGKWEAVLRLGPELVDRPLALEGVYAIAGATNHQYRCDAPVTLALQTEKLEDVAAGLLASLEASLEKSAVLTPREQPPPRAPAGGGVSLADALARRRAMEAGEIWASDVHEGRLWLGSGRDAQNLGRLREHGITHVLNAADDVPNFHVAEPGLTYLCLGLVDFGGDEGSARVFPAAVDFVQQALTGDAAARVLIHCANGSNRSVTVSIAVLMQLLDARLAHAWALVHARREQAAPLADNRYQLLEHEMRMRGSCSMQEGANGTLEPLPPGDSLHGASSGSPPDD